MASERMRKILPYVSIGVGILVYVLYYFSSQSWQQAQSDYERGLVEERQAKKRADQQFIDQSKPWISSDAKKIFKIIKREEKDGLIWIKLRETVEDLTYNLRYVESASGEKYTSNAGNLFWIKGNKAIFENKEGTKSQLTKTKIYKGLYSYMADANAYKICDSAESISVAMLGENIKIEQAYSKINRAGEDVYLEIEGVLIQEMSIEGNKMIDAIYPYKHLKIEDREDCK